MKLMVLTEEEQKAKKLIESLLPLQEDCKEGGYVFPCPRCGHERMSPVPARNALSRYCSVYICSECGMDEAMRDMAGMPPLPFTEWGMPKGFSSSESEDPDDEEDDEDE